MKKIESFSQLNEYDLIINCTGISSKYLNSDEKVKPIRGQIARVRIHATTLLYYLL